MEASGQVNMTLEKILASQQDDILSKWFDAIVESYPPETARFLKRESNPFANPVGSTVYEGIKGVYQELYQGMDRDKVSTHLDQVVRIRAVQEFAPSAAVGFIFPLKRLIRETLGREIRDGRVSAEELAELDSKIDALALLAFDIYTECRNKIYELRVNEVKNQSHRLLQRAKLIVDDPE
jgi:hypothetical protein